MRSPIHHVFSLVLLGAMAPAQAIDVGLTIDPGPLPVILGQDCGPVTCTAIPIGPLRRGETRTLVHWSAPLTPFVLGVAAQGPCLALRGIDNALLLGPGLVTLTVGLTSAPPALATRCNQGLGVHVVRVPFSLPAGVTLRFQSLGLSLSGAVAFGPALDGDVQ